MSTNNLSPKVRKSAKKILNLATKSRRSMQVNQMNFVRTSAFIGKEAKRISQPKIDKKKLKKLLNTDFASIASNAGGGGGGFNPLDLLGLGGGLGGGGGRRGGRPGRKPPSRRAQQRYRRRFGNRAGNRRFGRLPQFGRGGGIRVPRAGGVLGVAMAGLEYGGRLSEGQTQTQAITGTAASTAGGIAGAMGGAKGGAAIGALIGSIVPGAGTALGAAIGGLIGGIAGGMAGSSLAGGAADKLTGADKVIGKDEESEKAEKELQKKSKINPLELTLDKFDQVVDRFSEVIMSLDLGGNFFPEQSDIDKALEKYGPEKVIAILQAQAETGRRQQRERERLQREQETEAKIRQGFMGDLLADTMFPKAEEQDATSKVLGAVGVPESMQPATAMVVEAAIEAFAMSRGRGMKRPVMTRPLTKPYSLQGPELPPVQGPTQRIPSPAEIRARVVRSADTLPRPEVKPTEPLVRQPAQTVQAVLGRGRRARVKRTVDQVEKSQMRSEAELDAARDMAEGGYRRSQSTVEPQQNLIEGQTTLPDGSTVYYRKPMGRSAASRRKQLEPSKETQTDSEVKIMERDQDQLQSDILSDKVRSNQTIQDALDQAARDAERLRKIEKRFTPKTTNPLEGQNLSSINQYTTYNAPNNTTIIMQNGGQMPPQSPPPQMMASAPPPKMPPGPSTYDLASTLGTAILINKLQEC